MRSIIDEGDDDEYTFQKRCEGSNLPTRNQGGKASQQPMKLLKSPSPTESASLPLDSYWSTKSDGEEDNIISTSSAGSSLTHTPLYSQTKEVNESDFLAGLAAISRQPPAVAYLIPSADIPVVQDSAARLGFHTRVEMPKKESAASLIIVGGDRGAVEILAERLWNSSGAAV